MHQGKKTLLLLLTVFLLPVILGTGMFLAKDKLGIASGQVNYGMLVTPAKPTHANGLEEDGKAVKVEDILHRKWTMVFLSGDGCDQFCQQRLLLMKNVRLLLNEDMRRIRTVMVTPDKAVADSFTRDYPDLIIMEAAKGGPFYQQFPNQQDAPIYLVDPLGNLMMFYPQASPDAKLMIKDLKRLLKYSHVG